MIILKFNYFAILYILMAYLWSVHSTERYKILGLEPYTIYTFETRSITVKLYDTKFNKIVQPDNCKPKRLFNGTKLIPPLNVRKEVNITCSKGGDLVRTPVLFSNYKLIVDPYRFIYYPVHERNIYIKMYYVNSTNTSFQCIIRCDFFESKQMWLEYCSDGAICNGKKYNLRIHSGIFFPNWKLNNPLDIFYQKIIIDLNINFPGITVPLNVSVLGTYFYKVERKYSNVNITIIGCSLLIFRKIDVKILITKDIHNIHVIGLTATYLEFRSVSNITRFFYTSMSPVLTMGHAYIYDTDKKVSNIIRSDCVVNHSLQITKYDNISAALKISNVKRGKYVIKCFDYYMKHHIQKTIDVKDFEVKGILKYNESKGIFFENSRYTIEYKVSRPSEKELGALDTDYFGSSILNKKTLTLFVPLNSTVKRICFYYGYLYYKFNQTCCNIEKRTVIYLTPNLTVYLNKNTTIRVEYVSSPSLISVSAYCTYSNHSINSGSFAIPIKNLPIGMYNVTCWNRDHPLIQSKVTIKVYTKKFNLSLNPQTKPLNMGKNINYTTSITEPWVVNEIQYDYNLPNAASIGYVKRDQKSFNVKRSYILYNRCICFQLTLSTYVEHYCDRLTLPLYFLIINKRNVYFLMSDTKILLFYIGQNVTTGHPFLIPVDECRFQNDLNYSNNYITIPKHTPLWPHLTRCFHLALKVKSLFSFMLEDPIFDGRIKINTSISNYVMLNQTYHIHCILLREAPELMNFMELTLEAEFANVTINSRIDLYVSFFIPKIKRFCVYCGALFYSYKKNCFNIGHSVRIEYFPRRDVYFTAYEYFRLIFKLYIMPQNYSVRANCLTGFPNEFPNKFPTGNFTITCYDDGHKLYKKVKLKVYAESYKLFWTPSSNMYTHNETLQCKTNITKPWAELAANKRVHSIKGDWVKSIIQLKSDFSIAVKPLYFMYNKCLCALCKTDHRPNSKTCVRLKLPLRVVIVNKRVVYATVFSHKIMVYLVYRNFFNKTLGLTTFDNCIAKPNSGISFLNYRYINIPANLSTGHYNVTCYQYNMRISYSIMVNVYDGLFEGHIIGLSQIYLYQNKSYYIACLPIVVDQNALLLYLDTNNTDIIIRRYNSTDLEIGYFGNKAITVQFYCGYLFYRYSSSLHIFVEKLELKYTPMRAIYFIKHGNVILKTFFTIKPHLGQMEALCYNNESIIYKKRYQYLNLKNFQTGYHTFICSMKKDRSHIEAFTIGIFAERINIYWTPSKLRILQMNNVTLSCMHNVKLNNASEALNMTMVIKNSMDYNMTTDDNGIHVNFSPVYSQYKRRVKLQCKSLYHIPIYLNTTLNLPLYFIVINKRDYISYTRNVLHSFYLYFYYLPNSTSVLQIRRVKENLLLPLNVTYPIKIMLKKGLPTKLYTVVSKSILHIERNFSFFVYGHLFTINYTPPASPNVPELYYPTQLYVSCNIGNRRNFPYLKFIAENNETGYYTNQFKIMLSQSFLLHMTKQCFYCGLLFLRYKESCYNFRRYIEVVYTPRYEAYLVRYFNFRIKAYFRDNMTEELFPVTCSQAGNYSFISIYNNIISIEYGKDSIVKIACKTVYFNQTLFFKLNLTDREMEVYILPNQTYWISPYRMNVYCVIKDNEIIKQSENKYKFKVDCNYSLTGTFSTTLYGKPCKNEICVECSIGRPYHKHCYKVYYIDSHRAIIKPNSSFFQFRRRNYINCYLYPVLPKITYVITTIKIKVSSNATSKVYSKWGTNTSLTMVTKDFDDGNFVVSCELILNIMKEHRIFNSSTTLLIYDIFKFNLFFNTKENRYLVSKDRPNSIKCNFTEPYNQRQFFYISLFGYDVICKLYERKSNGDIYMIKIRTYNFVKHKIIITKNPSHTVYFNVYSNVLFRCILFPNVYLFLMPPTYLLLKVNDSVIKPDLYRYDSLVFNRSSVIKKTTKIEILCQWYHKKVYLMTTMKVLLLDRDDAYLTLYPKGRILFLKEQNDMVYCVKSPTEFENDKTYKIHYEGFPGQTSIETNNLNLRERSYITCYCTVSSTLTYSLQTYIFLLENADIHVKIVRLYSNTSTPLVINSVKDSYYRCIIDPLFVNDTTIRYNWVDIYDDTRNFSRSNGILTIHKNTASGGYEINCEVIIGKKVFKKKLSFVVIEVNSISTHIMIPDNRTTFLDNEFINMSCLIFPPSIRNYIKQLGSYTYPSTLFVHLVGNELKAYPPQPAPKHLNFTCHYTINSLKFYSTVVIETVDRDSAYIVFEPANEIIVVEYFNSYSLNCRLMPAQINAFLYFQYSFNCSRPIITMIKEAPKIDFVNMTYTGLANCTCTITVNKLHFNKTGHFLFIKMDDLNLIIICKKSTFYSWPSQMYKIILRVSPREILLSHAIQFSVSELVSVDTPSVTSSMYQTPILRLESYRIFVYVNSVTIPGLYAIEIYYVFQGQKISKTWRFDVINPQFNYIHFDISNQLIFFKTDQSYNLTSPENASCKFMNSVDEFTRRRLNFINLSSYPNFTFTKNVLTFLGGNISLGEHIFICFVPESKSKCCFHAIHIITVMYCLDLRPIPFPRKRAIPFINKLSCELSKGKSLSSSYGYHYYLKSSSGYHKNCSIYVYSNKLSMQRRRNHFSVISDVANCKLEYVCILPVYAGYSLISQINTTFIRLLSSNISLYFTPRVKLLFLYQFIECIVNGVEKNLRNKSKLSVNGPNGEFNINKNIFKVTHRTTGGHYKIRCSYTTFQGEWMDHFTEVVVHVPPSFLTVDSTTVEIGGSVVCSSNGYPNIKSNFRWVFYDGKVDFTKSYKEILQFEPFSPLGMYKYICTLNSNYEGHKLYLERLFNITVKGKGSLFITPSSKIESQYWMIKIVIAFLILYFALLVFMIRICTYVKLPSFYPTHIFDHKLMLDKYVIKFEPHSRFTYHFMTSYLIMIAHFYIPYEDEEFMIEMNQNLLQKYDTHDCTEETLRPLKEIMRILESNMSEKAKAKVKRLIMKEKKARRRQTTMYDRS